MQKWEYIFLTIDRDEGLLRRSGPWKVRFVNGEELQGWKDGPDLSDHCNQLGAEGWEMFAVSQSPIFDSGGSVKKDNFRIVMKRPRS